MIKIIISECLYGERAVRYDGAFLPMMDERIAKWKEKDMLVPVCPEIMGGLPCPREESQRKGTLVITKSGKDVTAPFEKGAEIILDLANSLSKDHTIICLLKESSPSCGVNQIHDGNFCGNKIPGKGITAERLSNAGFKIFSEKELDALERYIKEL